MFYIYSYSICVIYICGCSICRVGICSPPVYDPRLIRIKALKIMKAI